MLAESSTRAVIRRPIAIAPAGRDRQISISGRYGGAIVGQPPLEQVEAGRDAADRAVAELRRRADELERANRDLEKFAHSVAHDLRAPLQAMSGFSAVLLEDYGDVLDEAGQDYARRIHAASEKMATLIDDLLQLTRISGAELHLQTVDLGAEVARIAAGLQRDEPGRPVQFAIQRPVPARADRSLISTALQSLVENAWKFTSGRDEAAIEFGMMPAADAAVCCYLRDNGAGFDPAYTRKLFQPFQRLHESGEFPGSGLGLAGVRRIVERHGGRVWAEGAVGGGATFYFTLGAEEIA
jgi:signal transduction histidine kinase